LGAASIAAILSKPIPQYAVGTDNHPGGLAIVGEQGAEIAQIGGKSFLTPSTATVLDLPSGTKVIPHDESMKRLGMSGMDIRRGGSQASKEELKELKNISKTIRNKREVIVEGSMKGYRIAGSRVRYLQSLRNR
jgi:hypothetical protein